MKTLVALTLLLFTGAFASAQKPNVELPEALKAPAALITNTYPKVEAKKSPKAPADSVWIFRGTTTAVGTVEVGFQGAEVVYMIFRRGAGGTGWKLDEIARVHDSYHRQLLKEAYSPVFPHFTKYNHSVSSAIGAGVITRKDFDAKALNSAF